MAARGSPSRSLLGVAPVLDALGLVLFVVLGRRQHHIHAGSDEFWDTLWPFLAGWFAAAVATRLYLSPLSWRRALPTWLVAVPLAMWLRIALTHRTFFLSFTIVATIFVGLLLLGWRAGWFAWRRFHARRGSAADLAH
jgi:hypothetical protein